MDTVSFAAKWIAYSDAVSVRNTNIVGSHVREGTGKSIRRRVYKSED